MESVAINEPQNLFGRSDLRLRQILQIAKNKFALPQIAEGKFASHKRMTKNQTEVEQAHQRLVNGPQMLHPDRSIDQNHLRADRRRGGATRSGSLPPNRANRRALSRSIRALSASRTKADFSRSPVKA